MKHKILGFLSITLLPLVIILFACNLLKDCNYISECKTTEAQFGDTTLCTCINCDPNGSWIPQMTLEEFDYNISHQISDLPEEYPMIGDTIALYNHNDTIFVVHAGYKNGVTPNSSKYILTK